MRNLISGDIVRIRTIYFRFFLRLFSTLFIAALLSLSLAPKTFEARFMNLFSQ
jgi:hypothetical protein